jgi:hypothetical protein
VLDNSSTHRTPAIQKWLLAHPRFSLHFTPTSSSCSISSSVAVVVDGRPPGGRSVAPTSRRTGAARETRTGELTGPDRSPRDTSAADSRSVSQANRRHYRPFLLKEELRLFYHLDDRSHVETRLCSWLVWTSRSQLRPCV